MIQEKGKTNFFICKYVIYFTNNIIDNHNKWGTEWLSGPRRRLPWVAFFLEQSRCPEREAASPNRTWQILTGAH